MHFHQQPSGFLSDEHGMCVGKIKAHVSNLHPESVVAQVVEGHEVVSLLEGDPLRWNPRPASTFYELGT